jgi:hypothetical protein
VSSASTDWTTIPAWAAPAPGETPDAAPAAPARRRRRAVRLLIMAALVLLALVVVERFGRSYAEDQIAARLRASGVTGDIGVTVGSNWWRPTVLPALVTGDLDQVTVTVGDGSLLGLPVDDVRYVLHGLHGDVSLLNGSVVVRSLDRGTFVMQVPASVIGESLGVPVSVRDGALVAGDDPQPLDVKVDGDALVFSGAALGDRGPQSVPVVDPYLLPCRPAVTVVRGALRLACGGNQVPGILDAPLQGDDGGGDRAPVGELPPPQTTDRPADGSPTGG